MGQQPIIKLEFIYFLSVREQNYTVQIVAEFNFMGMYIWNEYSEMDKRQNIEPTKYETLLCWPFVCGVNYGNNSA